MLERLHLRSCFFLIGGECEHQRSGSGTSWWLIFLARPNTESGWTRMDVSRRKWEQWNRASVAQASVLIPRTLSSCYSAAASHPRPSQKDMGERPSCFLFFWRRCSNGEKHQLLPAGVMMRWRPLLSLNFKPLKFPSWPGPRRQDKRPPWPRWENRCSSQRGSVQRNHSRRPSWSATETGNSMLVRLSVRRTPGSERWSAYFREGGRNRWGWTRICCCWHVFNLFDTCKGSIVRPLWDRVWESRSRFSWPLPIYDGMP